MLLGVDPGDLVAALSTKKITTPDKKVITTPLDKLKAESSRDALSKAIYGRMFNWLVLRLNVSTECGAGACKNFIGILDIYGFEDLETNGFEQLFINYANEKLQHLFNEHIFYLEEEEYNKEGIQFIASEFPNNQSCLDLIEKPPMGILFQLEEECLMGHGNDANLARKLHRVHKEHEHYELCGPSTS